MNVAVIRTVPVSGVERVLQEMVPETDAICSVRCSHCGALNTCNSSRGFRAATGAVKVRQPDGDGSAQPRPGNPIRGAAASCKSAQR
jgi:hypothetical protein